MSKVQEQLGLEWSAQHSVGVAELDREHQRFFELARNLYDAMSEGASHTATGVLLGELFAYGVSHMTHEEDILEEYGYPELEMHRREHKLFRKQVREFIEEFDSGRTAMTVTLLRFLHNWQKSHLEEVDQRYVSFLRAKGAH